jgi:hypothetical protein
LNSALRHKPAEERDLEIEHDKVLLARVLKAMNEPDHFEPEEPRRWNPIAVVVFIYAGVLAFVIGRIAAERMF